jgi:hypothetical protein
MTWHLFFVLLVFPQEEPKEDKSQEAKPQEPNPEWVMVG